MGVASNSPLDLLGVVRIIIESAMIYTFQLLILIILFPLHHNAQLIVQSAVIPSMGIVFVLIAVRVQFSRSRTLFGETVMASMPTWLNEASSTRGNDEGERQQSPRHSTALQMVNTDDTQEKRERVLLSFLREPGPESVISHSTSAP
ncbi:hypothetical protein JR316_0011591 [Psilocybe cubensis]|uniref:Uncharacterized protein n=2 Tax=Psilocybe cubensis TaxID=181762 RepID=A0ACB8GKV9_PSICU|nr:hypothetical protein JR316_0011591 [Psilocybe cubensis]KAH9476022.1 hypothetical protein JR316_0011591 [Psilocybe cubensis]